MTVSYDASKPRAPDLSHYHYLTQSGEAAFVKAAPFAVMCKFNEDGFIDPAAVFHVSVAMRRKLRLVLYDFTHDGSPNSLSDKVKACRVLGIRAIGNADMEAKDLTMAEGEAWVREYEHAIGEPPMLYGHALLNTWHPGPTSPLRSCPSWQPTYGMSLTPVSWLPHPLIWQYAGGNPKWQSPGPRTFAGVSPLGALCDMNTLLDPAGFEALFPAPPPPPHDPGGGFMADLTEEQQKEMYWTLHAAGQELAKGMGLSGSGSVSKAWEALGAYLKDAGYPKP